MLNGWTTTGDNDPIKAATKCVRVHKYCQLAAGSPIVLAARANCEPRLRPREQVTQQSKAIEGDHRLKDRSVDSDSSMGGLSYIYELKLKGQLQVGGSLIDQTVTIWHLRVQSSYQSLPLLPPLSTSAPPPARNLSSVSSDLSLFYKACGLHSKALPLLHAA